MHSLKPNTSQYSRFQTTCLCSGAVCLTPFPSTVSERLHRLFPEERAKVVPKGGVCIMQPEGRGHKWVCVSQLMRVSADSIISIRRSLTAVEDSVPNITPRTTAAARHVHRTTSARRRLSVFWWLPSYSAPSCKIVSSPLMMNCEDATIGKSKPLHDTSSMSMTPCVCVQDFGSIRRLVSLSCAAAFGRGPRARR